ncbi:hypothetical protein [Azospirillum sp.]|uniref:hypothetical protein n=1 Tax=Azospirillum sp. TaxID=34012 RepID=UPI003D72776B
MRDKHAHDLSTDTELRRRIEKANRHLDSLMPLFELDFVDDGWHGRLEPASGAAEDEAPNAPSSPTRGSL